MVCDLWLVDFDPFCVSVFQGLVLVIVITIEGSEKQLWRQLLILKGQCPDYAHAGASSVFFFKRQ